MTAGTLTADSAYYAANILEQQGNTKDAKTLLEKATATTEPFPDQAAAKEMLTRLGAGKPRAATTRRSTTDGKGK